MKVMDQLEEFQIVWTVVNQEREEKFAFGESMDFYIETRRIAPNHISSNNRMDMKNNQ
jgi:hypothetical protein